MQIIYDDKDTTRSGHSFRLILLNSGWHIVATGYLYRGTDNRENRQLIRELQRVPVSDPENGTRSPRLLNLEHDFSR